jgi:hypothetical protein
VKTVIVTEYGEAPAPADFDRRYLAARKRKDGGVDKRFKEGRAVLAEEEALISKLTRQMAEKYYG